MFHLPKHGRHEGDLSLVMDTEFCGLVLGNVTVPAGTTLRFYGEIAGDLIVLQGGEAAIIGSVAGAVLNHGAVRIRGRVGRVTEAGSRAIFINDRATMENAPHIAMPEKPPAPRRVTAAKARRPAKRS